MTRLAYLASGLLLLAAAPAHAQRTSTVDDSIAVVRGAPPTPLSQGRGDGFAGMLGESSGTNVELAWDTDVLGRTSLELRDAQCTGANDVIVIYLDAVRGSGFPDTTSFTDTFSGEASAVSATPAGATLTFATGFEADYAIAIRNQAGAAVAYLFELVAGGSHVVTMLNTNQPAGACDLLRVGGFRLRDLGMAQGDDFLWFATVLNASNGFRSNEFHGVEGPDSNIGTAAFTLASDDYNVFTTIGPVVINEIEAQTPGSPDLTEFFELFGPPNARLDGAALVGVNGTDDQSYNFTGEPNALDLDGHTLDANGFWFAGSAAFPDADLALADNTVQQGADALALYLANGSAFPNDTPITLMNLVDAVVYDSGQGDDAGLLVLTPGQPQVNEAGNGFAADEASNQRCPDGGGGPRNTSSIESWRPSPGTANPCQLCGDGVIDGAANEECDDGPLNGTASSCCTDTCNFRPSGEACGALDGLCDAADACDATGTCVEAVQPIDTECRAAMGVCDVAEVCDGTTPACPADAVAAADVMCNASTGVCDPAESCDGAAKTCPENVFEDSSFVCNASAGDCDPAETCTGSSADCPTDVLAGGGTVCRAATANGCDVAETCSGSDADCPADGFAAATVVCRAAVAGGCDVEETCPGTNDTCPADTVQASTVVCRAAIAGGCDVEERCDGSTNACPADVVVAVSTECRASAGACDLAEVCDGSSASCPADAAATDGTACADGTTCNGDETCSSGVCTAGTALSCDDSDACTADACAEPGGCENTAIADCCNTDADCDDADPCTTDVCSAAGGTCANEAIAGCSAEDAGTPSDDAGTPSGDAGNGGADGGLADGGMMTPDAGCTCRAGAGSASRSALGALAPFGLLALLWARRRRRA